MVANGRISAAAAILTFMNPLRVPTRSTSLNSTTTDGPGAVRCCRGGIDRARLETVAERELPDAHEPGLRRDAPEARGIDLVIGRLVTELRGVGQVENLEPDLAGVPAGKTRVLGEHEIDVP